MITLLLGPYGHGKSTHILNCIKNDYEQGVHSFLIVPEQETLSTERQLAEALPPRAQLYTEATNLTRLADSVFRKTGGLKYNYVTKGGQNLIMYRTICEVRDLLIQYKIPKGHEKACIGLFLQAIGELKSYGVEIAQLEGAADRVENESFKARLTDLITIWALYDKLLKEMYDDPYDDLMMLEKKLGECAYFEKTNVYIDSFYGFTKNQLGVIKRIIDSAENVTIALDCPEDATEDTLQYAKIARTKSKIISLCKNMKKEIKVLPFDTDYKHAKQELAYLCQNIWSFDAAPIKSEGDVCLALANDEFDECEYVATQIRELVAKGEKYGDIAIIARNSSSYVGIVDFCLEKYDIPYYISLPSKLVSKPIIKMVLSALNFLSGMKGEDIVTYAKCGYSDIDTKDLYLLENYIYKWNIYGKKFKNDDYWNANPGGFVMYPSQKELSDLEAIQNTRRILLSQLAILEKPFEKGASVRECAHGVFNFLEALRVREKLLNEIKGEESSTEAQELSQVWGALVNALDLVAEICGDTVCDSATFTTLLSYAMMDTKIGTIPPSEDSVIVADASLVRAKNLRHVFVLGANVGVFPATINDTSFFTDRDKIELETLNIDLSALTTERGDDELLFFKNSIAAASHSVTVTALTSDINGGKKEESIGFSRIKELLDGISVFDTSTMRVIDKLYTEKNANELYGTAEPSLKNAISKCTGKIPPKPEFSTEEDFVSEKTAEEIFGKHLSLSKSRLECFVKCQFNYYCTYVLDLKDSEKYTFTHNDIGTLVHSVFEHFLKQDKDKRQSYTDEEILESVTRLTDGYTAELCGVRAISNKMRHLMSRLKSTVCVFVKSLLDEMKDSKFTPEYFELSINGDGYSAPLPMEIPIEGGYSVTMTGIADRVDIYRENGIAYVKIVDYKTGSYQFDMSKLDKGLDMQMLIYLLALCSMKPSAFKNDVLKWAEKIEPAGIAYLSYRINKTDADTEVDLYSDAAEENEKNATLSKITRTGLALNEPSLMPNNEAYALSERSLVGYDEFDLLFELVKTSVAKIGVEMLSGKANALPLESESPCDYCKNGAICKRRKKSERAR